MKKRLSCLILSAAISFAALFASGCEALGNGAASVGYGFASAIARQDYKEAYSCCYDNSEGMGSEEEFASRYTNVYSAMGVKSVEITNEQVSENGDYYTLYYTLTFDTSLMGTISYDYTADIMPDISGYSLIYTPSLILPMLETGDTVKLRSQYGKRGEIFDKNKNVLAKNDYAQCVYIETALVENIEAVKAACLSALAIDGETVQKKYDNAAANGFDTEIIKSYPKNTLSAEQIAALTAVSGLKVDSSSLDPIRYYPYQDAFAHVVGYVGSPTEEEIAADDYVSESTMVGKSGIESVYEQEMRGSDGKVLYVESSNGKTKEILYEEEKSDGEDIVLTLDADTQNKAYTLLATNLTETQSGCAIVMDYKTGAVEAMVSYPSFDPNLFQFPMDSAVWTYLNSEENGTPLYSRLTQAAYPPGSTFKPFSIVPAYEAGLINEDTVPQLNINNDKWIPSQSVSGLEKWIYPTINRSAPTLGEFNMLNALKSSDNIFYAYTAMLAGIDPFMAYMQKIGIGEAPEFELPLTTSNLLNEGTEMNVKILADMGYGMGELEITPVQLACMYTAFMNNGNMINPTVVDGIYKQKGDSYECVYEPTVTHFKENVMEERTIETITRGMKMVVENGTAYPARLPGVDVIGKTGTATLVASGENSREVNWIVLMGRDEGNQKLVLVMIDTKADEGTAKFTIAKELIKPEGYVDASEPEEDTEAPEDTAPADEAPSDNGE